MIAFIILIVALFLGYLFCLRLNESRLGEDWSGTVVSTCTLTHLFYSKNLRRVLLFALFLLVLLCLRGMLLDRIYLIFGLTTFILAVGSFYFSFSNRHYISELS
jgi:membrane protein required for beta-lactamase induction